MAIKLWYRTDLAWRNLTHEWRRLAVAVGGIAFAVLLMFMQTGFHHALLDSTVQVLHDLDADIVLVSKGEYAFPAQQRFSRARIYQARVCPEVEGAYPFYIENFVPVLKAPGRKGYPIRVLAYDTDEPIFPPPKAAMYREALRPPDSALMDAKSKAEYGVGRREPRGAAPPSLRLSGRELKLVGWFELGTDFTNDGNLLMSARNLAAYFPYRAAGGDPLEAVDLGLVQVRRGADVRAVQQRLRQLLPGDVTVFTKQELADQEKQFWNQGSSIGQVFGVGTAMGFLVGVIICYQILYASIANHLREFATLKAMGYTRGYFVAVVMRKSLYLSVLGFAPGVLVSLALYYELAHSTGLLMVLNLPRAAFVYALTLVMCVASGCLAMRKVLAADPADLF
jgi:putative ABC transport system permease protein